jgi:hypothetical protein
VAEGAADLAAAVGAAAVEAVGAAVVEAAAAIAVVAVAAATGKQTVLIRSRLTIGFCQGTDSSVPKSVSASGVSTPEVSETDGRVAHRAAARCVSARAAAFPARASSIRSTRPPAYR